MDRAAVELTIAAVVMVIIWVLWVRSRRRPPQPGSPQRRTLRRPARRLRLRHPRETPTGRLPKSPNVLVDRLPYRFAQRNLGSNSWYDLSRDGRPDRLQRYGLPQFRTPEELASWLNVPLNRLAWLSHRCTRGAAPGVKQSHYVMTWKQKRSGGLRLIESPKASLKAVQRQILHQILDRVPVSDAAHGFIAPRSIVTNAKPHVGAFVVLKFDLRDFYLSIGSTRVLRLFRKFGYSREAAIWLTLLTTSKIPGNLPIPERDSYANWRYRDRHLPQGAPTSPALANLAAYALDQRLAGLARSFGVVYTRYADDLTFSGDEKFSAALSAFIQFVEQLIRKSGFRTNPRKRQVLRRHQRQIVAGVVVNDRVNVCRRDFDRLKALLHQCVLRGPSSQNRDAIDDFPAHLRGRVAHVAHLNPKRGAKLQRLLSRIDWRR